MTKNVISVGYFPEWQSLKGQLPKCVISQAQTSQGLGKAFWGAEGCNGGWALWLGGEALPLGQILEVVAWEIAQLEVAASENAFAKVTNIECERAPGENEWRPS